MLDSETEIKSAGAVVPRACIAKPELRLSQYAAIDEYSRMRCLEAYPEQRIYPSANFLAHTVKWFGRRGVRANACGPTTALNSLAVSPFKARIPNAL
jgi:hypothetical protein